MKGLWLWLLASGNFRLADKEAAVQDDRTVGTGVWHGANVGGIVSQSNSTYVVYLFIDRRSTCLLR